MTQDETIEMARQAGFMLVTDSQEGQSDWYECFTEEIEAFAKLVAAKEREAMLDFIGEFMGTEGSRNAMFSDGYDYALGQMKELLEGRMKR